MKKIAATLLLTPLALACMACQPTLPTGQSATSSALQNPVTTAVSSAMNQTLTAAEVGAIYQNLATKGLAIEDIFFGAQQTTGSPVVVNGEEYYPFPMYASTTELRAAIEAVFTRSFAEQTFYDKLPPSSSTGFLMFIDHNGALYRMNAGGWGGDEPAIVSTIQITNQTASTITFHASVNAVGNINSADFRLVNVNGSWRLDCAVGGLR